jgi:hypothetical protein
LIPHPVVTKLRDYHWLAGQAAVADKALAGLVLSGVNDHLVSSQRGALLDYVAKLDAAHAAVRRA